MRCPALSVEEQDGLGADILLAEVKKAIQNLQNGKSLGEDGFSAEFSFVDLVAPRLLTVFRDALERGSLPESMQTAIITLIHKKGREPQQCGSYRPVSLINDKLNCSVRF